MARCEGTTRSGARCKREAREGSRFCYLHNPAEERVEAEGGDTEAVEFEDFLPLLLAGAATVAFLVVFKSLGRLIPRL
jgi:hypothetical protein